MKLLAFSINMCNDNFCLILLNGLNRIIKTYTQIGSCDTIHIKLILLNYVLKIEVVMRLFLILS